MHAKYKIEHNKFAVFDSKFASSGSYNWTTPASDKNSENCIFFIKNKKAVAEYQNRFNYLWQINTKNKSDRWFKKKLSNKIKQRHLNQNLSVDKNKYRCNLML